jgi:hypothetical protein
MTARFSVRLEDFSIPKESRAVIDRASSLKLRDLESPVQELCILRFSIFYRPVPIVQPFPYP